MGHHGGRRRCSSRHSSRRSSRFRPSCRRSPTRSARSRRRRRQRGSAIRSSSTSTTTRSRSTRRRCPRRHGCARGRRGRSREHELTWEPRTGDVAASGELGWLTGPSTFIDRTDPKAQPRYGNYLSVWRRQPGGAWRVFIDVGADAPQPVPFAPGFTRFPFGARYARTEDKTASAASLLVGRPRAQRPSRNGRRRRGVRRGADRGVASSSPRIRAVRSDAAAAEKWIAQNAASMTASTGAAECRAIGRSRIQLRHLPGERRQAGERRIRPRLDPRRGRQVVRRGGRHAAGESASLETRSRLARSGSRSGVFTVQGLVLERTTMVAHPVPSCPAAQENAPVKHRITATLVRAGLALTLAAGAFHLTAGAQDRLKTMPGYEQYQKNEPRDSGGGQDRVRSASRGRTRKTFEYVRDGKRYRYDVPRSWRRRLGRRRRRAASGRGGRGGGLERGRQAASADSPDNKLKAFYRDRNLWLSDAAGGSEVADYDRRQREGPHQVRDGELGLRRGALADDRDVVVARQHEDRVLPVRREAGPRLSPPARSDQGPEQGRRRSLSEGGRAEPRRRSVRVRRRHEEVDDGSTCATASRSTTPSSATTSTASPGPPTAPSCSSTAPTAARTSSSTSRRIPATGATRVILREEWPTGWIENNPSMQFLKDGRRFIWESSRNGWSNLYLYDLSGRLIAPLTSHTTFEVGNVLKIDEAAGLVFYTARDGDNYMKLQLHRVGLDGKGDVRLTDRAFHHIDRRMPAGAGGGGRGAGGVGRRRGRAARFPPTTSTSWTCTRPTTRRRRRAWSTRRPASRSPSWRRAISRSSTSSG